MKNKKKKGETIPSPEKKRSIRLRSVSDVNRLLAKIINDLLRNEIEESKAGKIGYLSNIMIKSFEISDIEKRITVLEQQNSAGKVGHEPQDAIREA